MPGKKTSELPIATTLATGDFLAVYRSSATLPAGQNVRISEENLLAMASGFTALLASEIPAAHAAAAGLSLRNTLLYLFNHLGSTAALTPLAAPTNGQAATVSASALSLSMNSVSGAAGYRFFRSLTAGGTYAQVGGTQATPSYYNSGLSPATQYFYKGQAVGDGTSSADSPLSAVFSGTTGAAALTTQSPASTDWWDATGAGTTLGAGLMRNTFSNVRGTTTADVLEIDAISSGYQVGLTTDYFGVYVNGVYQRVNFASDGTTKRVAVALPSGNGSKSLKIITHDLARLTVQTTSLVGAALVGVYANAAVTWQAPAAPAFSLGLIGDSISGGNSATEPVTQAFGRLLAAKFGAAVEFGADTASGGSMVEFYGPYATKAASLARARALCTGTTTKRLYLAYGTNDAGLGAGTPAQVGQAYTDFLTDFVAVEPNVLVTVITPFTVRASYDVEPTRVAIRSACAAFATVAVEEGPNMISIYNIEPAGVHPNTAGHAQAASRLYQRTQATPTGILAEYRPDGIQQVADATTRVLNWVDLGQSSADLHNFDLTGVPTQPGGANTAAVFAAQYMNAVSIPGLAAASSGGITLVMLLSKNATTAFSMCVGFGTTDGPMRENISFQGNDKFGLNTYTGAGSVTTGASAKLANPIVVSCNIFPANPNAFRMWFDGVEQTDAATFTPGNSGTPANDNHATRVLNGDLFLGGVGGSDPTWQGTHKFLCVSTLMSDTARQAKEAAARAFV